MKRMNREGFTLVEIMIVVAIIGILAAIAIPNFVQSRKRSQMNSCIANMKQLQGAFEQAKLNGVATPAIADLVNTEATAYIKAVQTTFGCPSDTTKTYVLPTGDTTVTCPAGLGTDGTFPHLMK